MKSLVQGLRSFQPKRTDGLDLSYIPTSSTEDESRIIAMCEPSDGSFKGSLMRNEVEDVAMFLALAHDANYRVYNLREKPHKQRVVDLFKGSHKHIPMPDHEIPRFCQILEFCEDVDRFLSENDDNVAVVHCKAGKGRTGTLIVCYLLYSGRFEDPDAALDVFAKNRSEGMPKKTKKQKQQPLADGDEKEEDELTYRGVDQCSQVRWIRHWWDMLQMEGGRARISERVLEAQLAKASVQSVTIETLPNFDVGGGSDPYIKVRGWGLKKDGGGPLLLTKTMTRDHKHEDAALDSYTADCGNLEVQGPFKIELWDKDVVSDDRMARAWFHAFFPGDEPTRRVTLTKAITDDAWKSSRFHEDFTLSVKFA